MNGHKARLVEAGRDHGERVGLPETRVDEVAAQPDRGAEPAVGCDAQIRAHRHGDQRAVCGIEAGDERVCGQRLAGLGGGQVNGGLQILRLAQRVQTGDHLAQLETVEDLRAVPERVDGAVGRLDGERRAAVDRGQPLAEQRRIAPLEQPLAQLALLIVVGAVKHVFERAVFFDELLRGLFAHAGNAGNVVGSIAHQPLHVDELRGREIPAAADKIGRDALGVLDALLCVEYGRVRAGELERVAVAGDDQAVDALLFALERERAQQIVGLVALQFDDAYVHFVQHIVDCGKLSAQFVGRGRAAGLVGVIFDMTERRRVQIERHGAQVGLFVGDDAQEHH